jgi:hypothetical protein
MIAAFFARVIWKNVFRVAGFAAVIAAVWGLLHFAKVGFDTKIIDPRVAKQVKPLNDQIAKYKEDSILVNTNNASLIDTLAEVRTEQLKTVQSLQSIIKQVEDRRKAENTQKELRIEFLESLVKELEKGLPPKECYSVGLFGKIKLIDCPKD